MGRAREPFCVAAIVTLATTLGCCGGGVPASCRFAVGKSEGSAAIPTVGQL